MGLVAAVNQSFVEVPFINDTSPQWPTNSRTGVLSSGISPGATTIPLVDASSFPNVPGMLRFPTSPEFNVYYLAKSGNTLTGVTGVTNSHSGSETVELRNKVLDLNANQYAYYNDVIFTGVNDYTIDLDLDAQNVANGQSVEPTIIVRHSSYGFIAARVRNRNILETTNRLQVYSYLASTDTWTLLASSSPNYGRSWKYGHIEVVVSGLNLSFQVSGINYQSISLSQNVNTTFGAGWASGPPGIGCAGKSGTECLINDFKATA